MRKFIALMLVAIMALTMFVACDKKENEGGTTTTVAPQSQPSSTKEPAGTKDPADTKAEETAPPTTARPDPIGIAYGKPKIDGKIDDAYKALANSNYVMPGVAVYDKDGTFDDEKIKATSYFLWDEEFFYVAVEVTDPKVVDRGEDYATTLNGVKLDPIIPAGNATPYENDCVENWFVFGGAEGSICKVSVDSQGYFMYCMGQDAAGTGKTPEAFFDIENSKKSVAKTDTGYIVELALKLDGDILAENSAGTEIRYSLQVNDVNAEDGSGLCCYGSQAANIDYKFVEAE